MPPLPHPKAQLLPSALARAQPSKQPQPAPPTTAAATPNFAFGPSQATSAPPAAPHLQFWKAACSCAWADAIFGTTGCYSVHCCCYCCCAVFWSVRSRNCTSIWAVRSCICTSFWSVHGAASTPAFGQSVASTICTHFWAVSSSSSSYTNIWPVSASGCTKFWASSICTILCSASRSSVCTIFWAGGQQQQHRHRHLGRQGPQQGPAPLVSRGGGSCTQPLCPPLPPHPQPPLPLGGSPLQGLLLGQSGAAGSPSGAHFPCLCSQPTVFSKTV